MLIQDGIDRGSAERARGRREGEKGKAEKYGTKEKAKAERGSRVSRTARKLVLADKFDRRVFEITLRLFQF